MNNAALYFIYNHIIGSGGSGKDFNGSDLGVYLQRLSKTDEFLHKDTPRHLFKDTIFY